MDAGAVDLDQPLRMYPLTYLDEGGEVTVGRADIDSYGLFPADGAALLRRLEAGDSPNQAAHWYEREYGECVDMVEFLEVLTAFDLLVPEGEEATEAPVLRWRRLAQVVFSWPACSLYAAVTIAGVLVAAADPRVTPQYGNLFFTTSSLVALTAGNVLGQLPWILLHEGAHALAGRRLGLNSTLTVGRRFYYLVFLTSLDGLVAVPRRKRYLPMLAGIGADVVVFCGLSLAAAPLVGRSGAPELTGRLLLAMAFGVLMRLAWQFYFFLRTDLYYLAATVLGCNDLQTVSRQMLQNRIRSLLGRHDAMVDPASWTARDRSVARWYVWLMLGGYTLLTVLAFTVMLPAAVRVTELAVHKLVQAPSVLHVTDVCVFLLLNFGELALAGYLAVRGWRRTSSTEPASPTSPMSSSV